ncbi:retropepsin family aspartate protease, PDZ/DHR/GLGF domain-containing [Citrifermentans bemidjiense Bem]|uniref:Retropepsin family aspartate protease, PDZ/DHR/GLGF domain-containing n=1 Tax=Citrifermentans bemidjiense (strain ATCC BAA-1014 / DSM 16622 / JCM 12645 / Bem) TaxID=404380 RepID=B5ECW7_CITBB|nr:aspartyl protease family protein [Citrifermentans bemidjiense]ACH40584.1 retropepsin family aspartate protease, PDZ/DHR/GLGF domain-containing [Citrifermentans bemidjiense Bem]
MKPFHSRQSLFLICFLLVGLLNTGCSAIKGVSMVRGGSPQSILTNDESVKAEQMAHLLTVKVRIDDSPEDLTFMVDTGALTVIDEQVAKRFAFKDSVTNKVADSAGNKKDVRLVQVNRISVGKAAVSDCAAAVVDMKKFNPKIDGLLGSNFLRFFTVQLDYRNQRVTFLSKSEGRSFDGAMKLPMWKNMKFGFAPTMKCEVDGSVALDCMVDTGHDAIASFPLSTLNKLPHFKSGEYISSNGSMGAGVFGKDRESYLVKTDRIASGPITIENAAIFSNRFEDVMTLGAAYLKNFMVTIDYPASLLYLKPFDDRHLEKEMMSYGFAVSYEKGKAIVSGLWKGSAADKAGLSVGDELIALNGRETAGMSLFDMMQITKSSETLSVSYIKGSSGNKSELTLRKGDLTLLFPRSPS